MLSSLESAPNVTLRTTRDKNTNSGRKYDGLFCQNFQQGFPRFSAATLIQRI
jgi:hypothetical protein